MKHSPVAKPAEGAVPRGCTNLKLRQLTRRVGQHYDRIVATSGLKTTQYSLLTAVVRLGPLRPTDLARVMQMDASTLTRNLQPLLAQGWIEVGPGVNGRSRVVSATLAGHAKRDEGQLEWKRAQLALNDLLGSDRVAALHALLEECLESMTASEEEDKHA